MWTSELAMSVFTSCQYIGDTGNQCNLSQRKYFILHWKPIYFLASECKTSTLSIIWWSKLIQFNFAQLYIKVFTKQYYSNYIAINHRWPAALILVLSLLLEKLKLKVVPWKSRARKSRTRKLKSCRNV